MAGLDLSSLSALQTNLGALVPSSTDILQQVAVGAASGVVLAGLKSQVASGALDPLGLFNHQQPAAGNAPPTVVSTTTITASAFSALPAALQAQLQTSGVHIVAG
jgi:hypothetical protein